VARRAGPSAASGTFFYERRPLRQLITPNRPSDRRRGRLHPRDFPADLVRPNDDGYDGGGAYCIARSPSIAPCADHVTDDRVTCSDVISGGGGGGSSPGNFLASRRRLAQYWRATTERVISARLTGVVSRSPCSDISAADDLTTDRSSAPIKLPPHSRRRLSVCVSICFAFSADRLAVRLDTQVVCVFARVCLCDVDVLWLND